jgi:GNAT superfamily N-acetyltransferase
MDYPKDWESTIGIVKKGQDSLSGHGAIGHQEQGRTIVLHSVAIAPGFQGRGMGGVLMKSYIASMAGAGVADRLALLAHKVCYSHPFALLSIELSSSLFVFDSIYTRAMFGLDLRLAEWYTR